MLPLFLDFLTSSFPDELLTEANIINIKEPLGQETSIHKYLQQFTEQLGTPELKNMFVKKIATLLINDERFHVAVRELPANAPEWAQKALEQQLLYAFIPTQNLNDTLTHMVHYLSAAAHDASKGATNDQKVFAQRELQGFSKAENLEVLDKKAKEYFARGGKKEARDIEGMEQVFDVGGGYVWWKLIEPRAFQREGKTLQNCIGSHYTADRCKKDNTVILVLRDANSNSVVATRIRQEGTNWVVQEIKGKQNRPPIGKYMPPVVELFKKMNLKLAYGAEHDLTNAGYYYHDGKLYTKAQAIKELITFEKIETIGYGLTFGKIKTDNLVGTLYSSLVGYNWREYPIYESRDSSGKPVVSVSVEPRQKIVAGIWFHPSENVVTEDKDTVAKLSGSSKESLLIKETVAALFKHDIVTGFSEEVSKEFFWNRKEFFDPESKEFKPAVPDEAHEFGKETAEWKEYKNANVINTVYGAVAHASEYREGEWKLPAREDIVSVIMTDDAIADDQQQRDKIKPHRVLFKDKNGKVFPAMVSSEYTHRSHTRFGKTLQHSYIYHDQAVEEDPRITKSLVQLANKQNLELSPAAQMNTGVFKNKEGKWEKVDIKLKNVGAKGGQQVDFDQFEGADKIAAIYYAIRHYDLGFQNRAYIQMAYPIKMEELGKLNPTDVYRVPIKFGAEGERSETHQALLLTRGKAVVAIDGPTISHSWKRWDDYQKVVKQLNDFVEEQGLTVDPSAVVTTARSRTQLTTSKGKFDLRSAVEQRRIERNLQRGRYGAEGADEVPFVSGAKIKRVSPQEQAVFMRTVVGASKRGEMWKVLDEAGRAKAVFFVQNKKIVAAYHKSYGEEPPTTGELTKVINEPGFGRWLRYAKAAADKFGWTFVPTKGLSLARDSRFYDMLSVIRGHGAAGKEVEPSVASRYYDLEDAGLVTITDSDRSRPGRPLRKITITPQGIRVFMNARDTGAQEQITTYMRSASVAPSFKIEKKEPERVAAPAAGGAPAVSREGSKADLAVQRFREMMAANNNTPPSRQEFMRVLQAAPFNMTPTGAQTYYYNTKKKVAQIVGEHTELGKLLLADIPNEGPFSLFNEFLAKSTS